MTEWPTSESSQASSCSAVGTGLGDADHGLSRGLDHAREATVRLRNRAVGRGIAVLAFCLVCVAASRADAQVIRVIGSPGTPDDEPSATFGMVLDEELQNALDDYRRHANRGLWEKAITTIEELDAGALDQKMVALDGGVLLSGTAALQRIQTELTAEGREAFRLFLGPKARQLYEQAVAPTTKESDRNETLRTLRRQYFASDVGDNAANLLGDSAFRLGNFPQAASYYDDVLRFHPDSELPERWVLFKRGMALALAGEAVAAENIAATLVRRFGGETVTMGGREVDPAATIRQRLTASADEAEPSLSVQLTDAIEPVWQHEFVDKTFFDRAVADSANSWRSPGIQHHVPPVVADDERLYINYLSAVSAIDLRTGKRLWIDEGDDGEFENLASSTSEINTDLYHLSVGPSGLYAVMMPAMAVHYYGSRPELFVFDKATGKKKWSTLERENGFSSDGWFVVGTPAEIDGDLYYIAGKNDGYDVGEMQLRVHPGVKKKPVRESPLGRYRSIGHSYQSRVVPTPAIEPYDNSLLLFMDEGLALAAEVLEGGETLRTKWGVRYESRPAQSQRRIYYGNSGPKLSEQLQPLGQMVRHGQTLFLKDAHIGEVVVVDLTTQRIEMKRPVAEHGTIVGVDDRAFYVLGEELAAYSREDGEPLWFRKVPRLVGGASAVALRDSLVVFTDLGLYEIDAATGDVRRILRGFDESDRGGRVLLAGDLLLTVSPRFVTAYRLPQANATAQTDAAVGSRE